MGIALTLDKLKHYRAWLEQAGYEESEEQVRYEEYLRDMRYDKAMSKLAEDMYLLIGCPVCDEDCVIESDWADCNACQIRWNIEDSDDGFIYLEAHGRDTLGRYIKWDCDLCGGKEEVGYVDEDQTFKVCEHCDVDGDDYNPKLWEAEDAEDYGVEDVWMAESFKNWADDELRTHGKNVTFDRWVEEEFEDEPAHRHPDGKLSFVQWARDEKSEKHHNAEEFCSECGYTSKKDAETFMAETESGTQVFNSCWKCGSGQHLYQINRYPASPNEIAGVGGPTTEAAPNWEAGRPVQR